MDNVETVTMQLEEINPAKYNPRKDLQPGDPEYESLKKSMQEFDCVENLVVNKANNNTLISGHQRLKVLKDLGYTEVKVNLVSIKEEEREKALNLALNKISGEWDMVKLKDVIEELLKLQEFDMDITGFDEESIDEVVAVFDNIDFEEFDGEGDGGGSQISDGDKVRVVIGRVMFDIHDPDHSIYNKTQNADADAVKEKIISLINEGVIL